MLPRRRSRSQRGGAWPFQVLQPFRGRHWVGPYVLAVLRQMAPSVGPRSSPLPRKGDGPLDAIQGIGAHLGAACLSWLAQMVPPIGSAQPLFEAQ